jgi:hypothetical protein
MRRFLASALVLLGVLTGTLGWSAWWLSSTLLDTERFARAADVVLASAPFEDLMVEQLSVRALAASPLALDPDAARQAARTALEDPRLRAQLRAALVNGHSRAVGPSTSTTIDPASAAPLAEAFSALGPEVGARAAEVFSADPLEVPVPSLGWLAGASGKAQAPLLGLTLGLFAAAVAVHPVRRRAVRTIGGWVIGVSAAQFLLLVAAPHWASTAGNEWVVLGGDVLSALGSEVAAPLTLVFCAGLALLVLGFVLPERTLRPAR